MNIKRNIFFAIIGSILVLIGLAFVLFFNPEILIKIKNSSVFEKFGSPKKPIEIVDDVYKYNYNFDSNIHNDPRVVEFIRGTDVDRYDKKIVITSDSYKKGASILENGNVISGYGHEIDYGNELVYLYIFVDPRFLTEEKLIDHLNLGYLGALLTASERNKLDKNSSYITDYTSASELAHEINISNSETNSYFLTKK